MIHLHLTLELPADDYGPHETYVGRLVLPSFAKDAQEAHAKLLTLLTPLTLLTTEEYFELPQHSETGVVPLNSETVRAVVVGALPSRGRRHCVELWPRSS